MYWVSGNWERKGRPDAGGNSPERVHAGTSGGNGGRASTRQARAFAVSGAVGCDAAIWKSGSGIDFGGCCGQAGTGIATPVVIARVIATACVTVSVFVSEACRQAARHGAHWRELSIGLGPGKHPERIRQHPPARSLSSINATFTPFMRPLVRLTAGTIF